MTKAIEARLTMARDGREVSYPIAAGVTIYQGTMVALDSAGYARPANDGTSSPVVGVAQDSVVAAIHAVVTVRRGCFGFDDGGVTFNDIGYVVCAKDDQSVGGASSPTPTKAGTLIEIELVGNKRVAWVDLIASHPAPVSPTGAA